MKFTQILSLVALAFMPASAMCKKHLELLLTTSDELSCASKGKAHSPDHIKPGHCEHVKHRPFSSFRLENSKHPGLLASQDCKFITYDLISCKGKSLEVLDLSSHIGMCQNSTFLHDNGRVSPARSAKLVCRPKQPLSSTSALHSTTTSTSIVTVVTETPQPSSSSISVPVVVVTSVTRPVVVENDRTVHTTLTETSTATLSPVQASTITTVVTSANLVKGGTVTATHTETTVTTVPATPKSTQTRCKVLCSTSTVFNSKV